MSTSNDLRELHGFRLFGYILGNFGFSLTVIFVGVFSFQFYVYTCNLDSILVSIGNSIQFISAAISAIIFGVLADNKKPGRFGKRRPFMMIGLPFWFLACVLVWFPPLAPQDNSFYLPTAIFFWTLIVTRSIFGNCMMIALVSMFPEQSQTLENRQRVASISTFLQIISSIIAMFLPMLIQSMLDNPQEAFWWQPSGQLILFWAPAIGISLAILGLISLLTTILSIDESFHEINENADLKEISFKDTFKKMFKPAKDKNFQKVLTVEFFNRVSGRIFGILIIPLMTYVLLFNKNDFFIYTILSIVGKFSGYFLFKKINKTQGLMKSYKICILFAAVSALVDMAFLIESISFEIKLIIFVITMGAILGGMYAFTLFSSPLTSALIDEAELKMNKSEINDLNKENNDTISGAYFGLQTFLASIATSIVSLIIGTILTGSNKSNPMIISITFSFVGISYLCSFLALNRIKMDYGNNKKHV